MARAAAAPAGPKPGKGGHGKPGHLPFTPIAPAATTVDDVTVPAGYRWDPILRWGDPILPGAPAFDGTRQTPEAQAGQFGYNNDYLDIIETNRAGTSALLVCNHEYTNEGIMFPPGTDPATVIRTVVGRARHVRRASCGGASAATPGRTSRAPGSTAGSPSTPRSPSTARPPGPTC